MTPADEAELVDRATLRNLCTQAMSRSGASPKVAELLAEAALFAEDHGFSSVGASHLLDFAAAMREGRLDGGAAPSVAEIAPALLVCDARQGIFHTGFDVAFHRVVASARSNGVTVLVQHGAYAGGQLGWFTDRVARAGLMALATVTSSPLMSTGAGVARVFGTNPMAFSVPCDDEAPITVDQASSAAAFASVREAASTGATLPDGWALDAGLQPTNDPAAALDGAMLPFGGYKGANIAWFVELFSSLAGGSWSIDAPSAFDGKQSPSVGMFLLAIDPTGVDPGYATRVRRHVERLAELGVRRPGLAPSQERSTVPVPGGVLNALQAMTRTS